jgi:hypothetical protein
MISTNEFRAIAEFDLEPIKVKLMHKESGEGWTLEYANQMEFEYRRFLYLMKLYPKEAIAPLVDVDVFWHYHILDTMKYAVDCDTLFGYFLHHYPYLGLGGEEDSGEHERVGNRMKELYEQAFGEPCVRALPEAANAGAASGAGKSASGFVNSGNTAQPVGPAGCLVNGRTAAKLSDNTAWCFVTDGDGPKAVARPQARVGQTAWCFVVDGGGTTAVSRQQARAGQTAWCFVVDGGGTTAVARQQARAGQTAWCFIVDGGGTTAVARPSARGQITSCFVDGHTAANARPAVNPGKTAWRFIDGATTTMVEATQIKLGRKACLQTGRPALAQA